MFVQILIPVIVYVITSTIDFSPEEEVQGEKVVVEEPEEKETSENEKGDENNSDNKPTPIIDKGESSSVEIKEGESSVSINIDNNSIEGDDGDNGSSISISEFSYPGANTLESSSQRVVLETSDSPSSVTNWYEERIKTRGMNTTSFVKTSTNGSILNKLGAAGVEGEILVEISGENNASKTRIVVTVG